MKELHRKEKKTYNRPGDAHYLTFSCNHYMPLLCKERSCLWLVEAIQKAKQKYKFDIYAYVIMPDHVHIMICPKEKECRVENILAAIKNPVSRRAKQYLMDIEANELLEKLTICRGDKKVFRFWLPGGGYDKNICRMKGIEAVIEYIHGNPMRKGYVEKPTDWIWSSVRYWAGMNNIPLRMDSIYG
jgi:putative transposase